MPAWFYMEVSRESPWGLSPISVAQLTSQRTISLRRQVMVFRVIRITCNTGHRERRGSPEGGLWEGVEDSEEPQETQKLRTESKPYSLGEGLHLSGPQLLHL